MTKAIVLIVEDEVLLRMDAVSTIESAGCLTLEAGSADEAIGILERRRDIGVVFTDINMPGSVDGLELAHAVHDRWPPIRLIVTSGNLHPSPTELPHDARFLSKPYQPYQLLNALRN